MDDNRSSGAASLAIKTAGLGKRFGPRIALESVDLQVPRGTAHGFLGANGAGKTTLIRLLLGLAAPTTGTVELLGMEMPAGRPDALARVGAIVEEPRFHSHLSGRENLEVHAAARPRSAGWRIDHCLDRVGLGARADDKVKSYSMGMRQRLGVARCLLPDPELLILDEPLNGLDPAGILEMRALIRELVDEGRTVLLSSHLLGEVEKTCDSAAIVDSGRIVAQGSIGELVGGGPRRLELACSDHLLAARILAAMPEIASANDQGPRLCLTLTPEAPVDREVVTEILRRLLDQGAGGDLRLRARADLAGTLGRRAVDPPSVAGGGSSAANARWHVPTDQVSRTGSAWPAGT